MEEKNIQQQTKPTLAKKFSSFVKPRKKVLLITSIIILCVLAVTLWFIFNSNNSGIVNTEYLLNELSRASELTTAKLKTTGISEFEDDGIWLLSKSNFVMVYTATVRAGIDISKVSIAEPKKTDKIIRISIPKAEVLDAKVDPSDILFYDEKFALFNLNEKEDMNRAIVEAEKLAIEKASTIGILELADNQAEVLIKGILTDLIPDGYIMQVDIIEQETNQ